jgi:hypothetical protein
MVEETRERVRALIRAHGANAAARMLGLPRGSLLSIAAGCEREGTRAMAERGFAELGEADIAARMGARIGD